MNTLAKTALGAIFLLPGLTWAEASNFNYVEADYLRGEINDLDVDGWNLEGSVELTPQVFVEASYGEQELDESISGVDVEAEAGSIGVGYVFGENETGNFYGTAGYVDVEGKVSSSLGSFSTGDDGFYLGLGTRFNLGDRAELRFEVDYADVSDDDSLQTSAALVYNFTGQFAGVAQYRRDSDADAIGLGVRFYFR